MTKQKPNIKKDSDMIHYSCPSCGKKILSTYHMAAIGSKDHYCSNCGQEIEWNGVKIDTYWIM